jgi:hypothetical protein
MSVLRIALMPNIKQDFTCSMFGLKAIVVPGTYLRKAGLRRGRIDASSLIAYFIHNLMRYLINSMRLSEHSIAGSSLRNYELKRLLLWKGGV